MCALVGVLNAALKLHEGDLSAAREWMSPTARGLNSGSPFDMLGTQVETQAIVDSAGSLRKICSCCSPAAKETEAHGLLRRTDWREIAIFWATGLSRPTFFVVPVSCHLQLGDSLTSMQCSPV